VTPTIPINHYLSLRNQQNKTEVIFYYPMLMYSWLGYACFEHSNFFKVNDSEPLKCHPGDPYSTEAETVPRRPASEKVENYKSSTLHLRGRLWFVKIEIQLRAF